MSQTRTYATRTSIIVVTTELILLCTSSFTLYMDPLTFVQFPLRRSSNDVVIKESDLRHVLKTA